MLQIRINNVLGIFLISLVAGYGLIALTLKYINRTNTEIFPFFAWDLFAVVPNIKREYSIEIVSYNGIKLNEAVPLANADFPQLPKYNISARNLIQNFAQSYLLNPNTENEYQKLLERVYLGKTSEYRLVKKEYDPVEMYKKGTAKSSIVDVFKTHAR